MKSATTKNICFYFQVHQPFRINEFNVFETNSENHYFVGPEMQSNRFVFEKVAQKCYLPANAILLSLIKANPDFRLSFSLSGVFLEQCLVYGEIGKRVLDSFKKLVATGKVELLSETYYHSLSALFSKEEFAQQIEAHRKLIYKLFKVKTKVFRNTELIYNNEIGKFIKEMGFNGILAEGWDNVLGEAHAGTIFYPPNFALGEADKDLAHKHAIGKAKKDFGLLLKHYRLSDDIAFRFSNQGWSEHPLSTQKFLDWVNATPGQTINLFMDYETFGEHQWEDTGIFDFLRNLPQLAKKNGIGFHTPSEALKKIKERQPMDIHAYLSWADSERDLSAWLDNPMQKSAMSRIFAIEAKVKKLNNKNLLDTWRKLQTSDHFYYMCTKYWSDGDVHAYFSPFESPYEAYINYTNILEDFTKKIENL